MRVLHTGDWHLGRTLEGRSRLKEQEAFIDELAEMVEAEGVDLVLIAGDVYDSVNPPAAAEQLYYGALDPAGGRRPPGGGGHRGQSRPSGADCRIRPARRAERHPSGRASGGVAAYDRDRPDRRDGRYRGAAVPVRIEAE